MNTKPYVPRAQDEDVGPEQVLVVVRGGPGLHEAQERVCSDQAIQTPHLPQLRQTGDSPDPHRWGGLRPHRVSGAHLLGRVLWKDKGQHVQWFKRHVGFTVPRRIQLA